MEKLLCPYCGGEMRRGWLRSRRSDIWWEPDPAASSDEEMRCIAAAAGFSGAEAERGTVPPAKSWCWTAAAATCRWDDIQTARSAA